VTYFCFWTQICKICLITCIITRTRITNCQVIIISYRTWKYNLRYTCFFPTARRAYLFIFLHAMNMINKWRLKTFIF